MNITQPRGIRNNNPGNIDRDDKTRWVGMTNAQVDPRFVSFSTMAYGIRAMVKILLTYEGEGFVNVKSIVDHWAPPEENDTNAYSADVAHHLGMALSAPINVRDPHEAAALVTAIMIHENGAAAVAAFVHSTDIAEGVALALN